jgi:hypothetical protein
LGVFWDIGDIVSLIEAGDTVAKPISKIAVALWAVAAIALVAYVYSEVESIRGQIALDTARYRITTLPGAVNPYAMDVGASAGAVIQMAILVGLGWIIELVDRILWHLKSASRPQP